MRTPDGYATGVALWRAVTDQAKVTAKATGVDTSAVIRRFVFGRFLARVFHDPSAPWVLKGGTAVLARVHDARTTKDVDLLHQLGDLNAAVEALTAAAKIKLDDHFRFVLVNVETDTGGQPQVDGCRADALVRPAGGLGAPVPTRGTQGPRSPATSPGGNRGSRPVGPAGAAVQ